MKKSIKKILIIILITILVLSFIYVGVLFIAFTTINFNGKRLSVEEYKNIRSSISTDFLFDIDKFNSYEDIRCYNTEKQGVFTEAVSFIVIAEYDQNNFEKEVNRINEEYEFFTDSEIIEQDEDNRSLPNQYKGFSFRVTKFYNLYCYPNTFVFIGINETENIITYCSFEDTELDYIPDFARFWEEDVYFSKCLDDKIDNITKYDFLLNN